MPYRQLKPQQPEGNELHESKLSDRPLALYIRQSTTKQVEDNTESLKLQLEDARERFLKQGWSDTIITIRHEGGGKKGVSGALRIDQRAELQETMADIEADVTKAVGAYSVSRLFRDKYGIQVGIFIEACAKHDVLVITSSYTFDFNRNPMDIFFFKWQAEQAAYESKLRTELLSAAKHKKALRGEYDGRPLIVGFLVDREKNSPTFGKFIPYEPHARVVRRLYTRFREVSGHFNVLAAEVAAMPVIFPDFEEWVEVLNVKKLQLKKVAGGYHISRVGLMHLLTAIEYRGYWKVDGHILTDSGGTPLVNHAAIVPESDWQYAFTCLSFNTLDGLPNRERSTRTWVPVNKADKKSTLAGMLVSPRGTVQNTAGLYRITEREVGRSQRSTIVTADAELIDAIFHERLSERMFEIDHNQFFYEQLAKLKQQHAKMLVSIPEQIARYEKERANIQAYIKAVGATADIATLQQYNADLLEIAGHIAQLEAKKHTASVAESRFAKVIDQLKRLRTLTGSDGQTEESSSFLHLLIDTISLDEYSSHFLTLTIVWAAPFGQVDVCYIYRPSGGHQRWSTHDESDLKRLYPHSDRLAVVERFPTRSWGSIYTWACKLGLSRYTDVNTSGLTNRDISLADWRLLQEHGWILPEKGYGRYWLYDVKNDVIDSLSSPG